MAKRLGLLVGFFVVALGLAGCASGGLSDRGEFVGSLAVQYATAKVISRDDDPAAKAARVVQIATEAKALVDGGTVAAVDELHGRVAGLIRWDRLDAADRVLVDALLEAVRVELQARVSDNLLSEGTRLAVSAVLDDIIQAAAVYQAPG